MASIFDIPPQETGGSDAISGFEYQHRVAVGELLQMAKTEGYGFIEFDSHDDILISRVGPDGRIAEFVQVKAGNSSGLWTPSDLYADDDNPNQQEKHSSSLVAKQLRRAIGDDAVAFRVVTRSEVNADLASLKLAPESRTKESLQSLVEKLGRKLAHLTFPQGRTTEDWLALVRWQVAGPEEDLDNRNLQALRQVVFSTGQISLTPAQEQELYERLLNTARQAARQNEPRELKRCTRTELLIWLGSYCSKLPVHLPPVVATQISQSERESIERCVGRWQNSGLPLETAQSLAADKTVGLNAVEWILAQPERFIWLNGQFGSGKSLAADQVYQRALSDYASGKQNRLPVFLEAKALSGQLRDVVYTYARKIGDPQRHGVHLIVDGADERTLQQARDLLRESADFSRANPSSKVLVTSSILEMPGLEPKSMPRLSEMEARSLLARLTGSSRFDHFGFDARLRSDFENPFFVIQYARFGAKHSRADLVRLMVEAALDRVDASLRPSEQHLMKLAVWQLDHGSPLIPETHLGPLRTTLSAVLETRLIEKRSPFVTFTVECVVQWFAAQAIISRQISIPDLCSDLERLERWRFSIAMALARADEDSTDRIMRPLAEEQPAFASLVLRDAVLGWGLDQSTRPVAANEVAQRIRKAMSSWKRGLEPVSSSSDVFPVDRKRDLLKVEASTAQGRFNIVWHERAGLPAAAAGAPIKFEPSRRERSVFWGGVIIDHTAWPWKTTHQFIKQELKKATSETALASASEQLLREAAWKESCDLMKVSDERQTQLVVSEIMSRIHLGFSRTAERLLLVEYLGRIQESGADVFVAPYPQADSEFRSGLIWELFSLERAVDRAQAIYGTALSAYRETVETLFPKMANRFPHYAAWPFNLKGVVRFVDVGHYSFYSLDWLMESLPIGSSGGAIFSAGSEIEGKILQDRCRQNNDHADSKASWRLRSYGSSILPLWEGFAAAKLVQQWLRFDLESVGW